MQNKRNLLKIWIFFQAMSYANITRRLADYDFSFYSILFNECVLRLLHIMLMFHLKH